METFFSLPGGNVDDANNDAAKNSSRRLMALCEFKGGREKRAYIVRGINALRLRLFSRRYRVVDWGQCRKKNVSRVTMRRKRS